MLALEEVEIRKLPNGYFHLLVHGAGKLHICSASDEWVTGAVVQEVVRAARFQLNAMIQRPGATPVLRVLIDRKEYIFPIAREQECVEGALAQALGLLVTPAVSKV